MKLAEGRPLRRRMMAAMAQQDCGQCGYNCNDYSDKIFDKSEERLNLCVPGGKETARMLKSLYEEIGKRARCGEGSRPKQSPLRAQPAGDAGRSRDNPATATFVGRYRLNKDGSEKETWHLDFDLSAARLDYVVGDAFGLFPKNDPALADADHRSAWRVAGLSRSAGARLRDILIDRRVALARTGLAVPAVLLHHRRRAAAEGEGAGVRRRPGRRCRDARRAGDA